MYRILIVEDDAGIAAGIEKGLLSWELETRCASDFKNILSEFSQYEPHLIILDISLPFFIY